MHVSGQPAAGKATSLLERKLLHLGLRDPSDFIVHLPVRYEDETRITPIADIRPGIAAQVEGEVVRSEVQFRPRRQLHAVIRDDTGQLVLRWLNFYPSQQKQVEAGKCVRVRGEVRSGFGGYEMVNPKVSVAGMALSNPLTPVYPTTDGLPQASLRRSEEHT